MGRASTLRAVLGLTAAQLRYYRSQTVLAVVGVALAVSLMVLLAGLGYGLTHTGAEAMTWIEADLWVTGGPVALTPTGLGGVENPIQGSHELARDTESADGVAEARPLAFQAVYVSTDGESFDTVVGVGGLGTGRQLGLADSDRFTPRDVHYANGSYDGPMTHEVVVDPQTARQYDLSVGDTLHVGSTITTAREHEFEVVAVRRTFSNFLGTPTVAMHLSELQEVSGTTGTDRAALVLARVDDGADVETVKGDLSRDYPEYEVRNSDEQVSAIIGNQAAVIASAATLVVLAVVAGIVLLVNVLALLVHQQRHELAALKAAGVSARPLVATVAGQGIALGLLGGVLGVVATPLAVDAVNHVAREVSGFPNLVKTPYWIPALGLLFAVAMGTVGATVAGWRVARLSPLEHLRP